MDLAQQLVDKLVFSGKLNERLLRKFCSQQLASLQLSSLEVTNSWLAATTHFALQHLSLANCSQVEPAWAPCVRASYRLDTHTQ